MLNDDEPKEFLATLGRRIKLLRKQKKLLMRDIMIKTGYYDAQWRKYEAGGNLNIPSLMKIALALDVNLIELLDGLGYWPNVSVAEVQAKIGNALESTPEPVAEPKPRTAKEVLSKPGAKNKATRAIAKTAAGNPRKKSN